jgi:hypothetical protein
MAFPNASILIDSRPDTVTIRGTAIHAAMAYGDPGPGPLLGCCDDITPMDITVALGTKDELQVLIPRHYIIPTNRKRTYVNDISPRMLSVVKDSHLDYPWMETLKSTS